MQQLEDMVNNHIRDGTGVRVHVFSSMDDLKREKVRR